MSGCSQQVYEKASVDNRASSQPGERSRAFIVAYHLMSVAALYSITFATVYLLTNFAFSIPSFYFFFCHCHWFSVSTLCHPFHVKRRVLRRQFSCLLSSRNLHQHTKQNTQKKPKKYLLFNICVLFLVKPLLVPMPASV